MRPSSIWYLAHPLRLSHPRGKSLFPKELTELYEAPLQKRLWKGVERKGAAEHTYSNPLGSGHPRTRRKILRVPGPASSKPDLVLWHVSVFKERKCKVLIFIKCMQRF